MAHYHIGAMVSSLALVASLALPSTAQAEAVELPVPAQPQGKSWSKSPSAETQWYGAPILFADLAATGLLIGSIRAHDGSGRNVLLVAGFMSYGLGSPIVHAVNSGSGKAAASLLLRLGLPAVVGGGFYLAASAGGNCESEGCAMGSAIGGLVGMGLGMVAAVVIDYAALASKPVRKANTALSMAPSYDPLHSTTMLNVSGIW